MECQVEKNEKFPTSLFYEFNRGSKLQRQPETFVPSTETIIAERTAQKWFARFKQGNFDMSDIQRSGRHLVGHGGDCAL
jgi:hypothetical protein